MSNNRYHYEITPWLRTVQRVLLGSIIIGLLLLVSQSLWVPPLVQYILEQEQVALRLEIDPVSLNETEPINNVTPTSSPVVSVPVATSPISASTTDIAEQPPEVDIIIPKDVARRCMVGGCSRELCTDDPSVVSTCLYREEYACYATAACARQETGECGWTMTPELNACLLDASAVR